MWALIFRHERWLTPLFWTLIIMATGWVNAGTRIADSTRYGIGDAPWEAYVDEFTGAGAALVLVPAVYWLVAFAFRHAREWWQFILMMIGGCFAFSALHITIMVSARRLIYGLFTDGEYGWGPVVGAGIYEFRKDVMSYVTILGIVLLARALRDAQMTLLAKENGDSGDGGGVSGDLSAPEDHLSFRSGASTYWVSPGDILYAQAAGNYVELHLKDGGTKLLRQTLSGLEKTLGDKNFARTHRSYIVRRAAIHSLEPTGSGDHVATLSGDRKVPVSRRYRGGIKTPV